MKKLTLLGALFLILLAAGLYRVLKGGQASKYRVSADGDVVTIDCGEFLSVYEPLEFRVPLKLLGLAADSVRKTVTTCSCTIPDLGPEDTHLAVTYKLSSGTTSFYQVITIIPKDDSIGKKFIRLRGKIIPAWFTRPASIVVDGVKPGERRTFTASAEINYELPQIGVDSVRLSPQVENITLDYTIVSNEKIDLTGTVRGLPEAGEYKGEIEIVFDTGQFEKLRLPVKISYLGTISAVPEMVSFGGNRQEAVVEFRHFAGNTLKIKGIDCPEHLTVGAVGSAEGKCLLKIGLKKGVSGRKGVIASKIEVTFAQIEQWGVVRVMVLPAAWGKM